MPQWIEKKSVADDDDIWLLILILETTRTDNVNAIKCAYFDLNQRLFLFERELNINSSLK